MSPGRLRALHAWINEREVGKRRSKDVEDTLRAKYEEEPLRYTKLEPLAIIGIDSVGPFVIGSATARDLLNAVAIAVSLKPLSLLFRDFGTATLASVISAASLKADLLYGRLPNGIENLRVARELGSAFLGSLTEGSLLDKVNVVCGEDAAKGIDKPRALQLHRGLLRERLEEMGWTLVEIQRYVGAPQSPVRAILMDDSLEEVLKRFEAAGEKMQARAYRPADALDADGPRSS